jgi:hypothetical protein
MVVNGKIAFGNSLGFQAQIDDRARRRTLMITNSNKHKSQGLRVEELNRCAVVFSNPP